MYNLFNIVIPQYSHTFKRIHTGSKKKKKKKNYKKKLKKKKKK